MSKNDPFDAWIAAQRAAGVPAGFADRVMGAVHERAGESAAEWWDRPWLQGAAWAAASIVVMTRAASALIMFWAG